jgi:hypothetical protein
MGNARHAKPRTGWLHRSSGTSTPVTLTADAPPSDVAVAVTAPAAAEQSIDNNPAGHPMTTPTASTGPGRRIGIGPLAAPAPVPDPVDPDPVDPAASTESAEPITEVITRGPSSSVQLRYPDGRNLPVPVRSGMVLVLANSVFMSVVDAGAAYC